MLETELKCLIDKATFDKVLDSYKWDKVIIQTNHYYRAQTNILKENGITFRVREIDSNPVLQIKQHKNSASPLQICEESEFEISSIPEAFSADDVKRYTGIDAGEVFLLGSATTTRHLKIYKNTEICLDKTAYLNTEDYEVELEYQGNCPDELIDEMKVLGVVFEKKSVGKYSRFIKRLSEILSGN